MISNWGGGISLNFGDTPTKWYIAKTTNKPIKTFVVSNASQIILKINVNKKKYNKCLSFSKSYNKQYSIIKAIIEYYS